MTDTPLGDAIYASARALDEHSLRVCGWTETGIKKALGLVGEPSENNLEIAKLVIKAYENRRADGWRDIDPASLVDDEEIWLANATNIRVGFWRTGKKYEHHGSIGGGWKDAETGRDLHFLPTHRQPLPAPPKDI